MSLFARINSFGLRVKFVLVVSGVIIASMLTISGYLISRQNDIYRTELEKRGLSLVKNLAYNAEYGVIVEASYELEDLIKGIVRENDIIYVTILSSDGSVLAEMGDSIRANSQRANDDSKEMELDSKLIHKHYTRGDGTSFIELEYPVETIRQSTSRENLGAVSGMMGNPEMISEIIGSVKVGFTFGNLEKEITKSQTASILLTLTLVISAIIIMTAFVKVIIKPIESLVEITGKISKGDLSKNVDIARKDEIGLLADSFNRMIESLKKSQEEVEEYNRNLEEKIIERTKELENTQAQLIQSEKMVAIGQLAAGVAHELNNPLGGILGYAQFTLEKIQKAKPESITEKDLESYKRYLKDIETQSRRCKAIVQNLLRFSRTSKDVDFSEVSINEVMEDTLTFMEHQLMMNQIRLEKNLAENLPLIEGNASQLQQVFTNIIINAMHASEPDSCITITSHLAPALGEFSGAVEVMISDEGHGISEKNLKKLYEPFFTTKEVGKGTGLGLSVSYGIIKEHGGEMKVKSKENVGTTFTIIIPLEKKTNCAENIIEQDEKS
ncbi:MAG: ATP-binding protein [Candidatus Zixiibacteriota bacterium]